MTVIVAGHICLDIIPQLSGMSREAFERSFTPGHLVQRGLIRLSTGGAVSNVGLGAAPPGHPDAADGQDRPRPVRAGRAPDRRGAAPPVSPTA